LNFSDVGSGGFDGFNDDAANQLEGPYYIGGHSAAIQPANYESLSKFVLTGLVERDERLTTRTQPGWLVILSRASILIWVLVFLLAFGPPIYFVLHAHYAAALAYILFRAVRDQLHLKFSGWQLVYFMARLYPSNVPKVLNLRDVLYRVVMDD